MNRKVRITSLLLVMFCLLSPVQGFSTTYKWMDAEGTVHFSDNPPPATRGAVTREDEPSSPSGDGQPTPGERRRRNKSVKPDP